MKPFSPHQPTGAKIPDSVILDPEPSMSVYCLVFLFQFKFTKMFLCVFFLNNSSAMSFWFSPLLLRLACLHV